MRPNIRKTDGIRSPPLPYEFKNLRILRSDFDFDITEENYNVTVTFIYDTVTLNGEEIGLQ